MNSNEKAIRIAIIDNNEHLGYTSINQLENAGYIVQFQVSDSEKALMKIDEDGELPDVCIVEEDFAAAKLLLEKHPDLKLLISSTDDAEESVRTMLKAGVSGYILKFADPDERITAVKALSKDRKYVSVGISEIAAEYFSSHSL